jgi:DNA-binding MarR family transcriptional regulator
VFATGLSAFTDEPINLFLKGGSSIGKTYNTVETLRYWPGETVWFLGGMSRKSLQHDYGVLKNSLGAPIDMDNWPLKPRSKDYPDADSFKEAVQNYQNEIKAKKEDLKGSFVEVNLWHRVLVFLEPPDYETFMALRPILSHDLEEITYRFVDKTTKSGPMRTQVVKLVGWPATVFLSIDLKYIEEMATRGFTITPEDSSEKLGAANILTNEKVSQPWIFSKETEAMKTIRALIQRLRLTVDVSEKPLKVIIPFTNLHELFPHELPRDMRDFAHFCQLLKAFTVYYFFQRPVMRVEESEYLLSTAEDVQNAYGIYKEVFETTRTGTEKRTLDFYWNVVVKHKDGTYLQVLTDEHNKTAVKKLSSKSIDRLCQRLEEIGYLDRRPNPEGDKRLNLFVPLKFQPEKQTNLDNSQMALDLMAKLENGFDSWLMKCGQNSVFYTNKKVSEGQAKANCEGLSHADLRAIILKNNFALKLSNSCPHLVKPESGSKTETTRETSDKPDLATFGHSSDYVS